MDEARRRRREHLARRQDELRARPTGFGGPAQRSADESGEALRARVTAEDRGRVFERRLAEVRRQRARHDAMQRRLRAAWLVVLAGTGLLVGALTASLTSWPVGVAAGVGIGVVLVGGRRILGKLAIARGASAWDWKAGKYRLAGRPADRVQQADRPPPLDPTRRG